LTLRDPSAPIVVNAGGQGFFRVAYDDELRSRIGREALATLNTVERYNLVDDASAAFVAGRLPAAGLLSFLPRFSDERELAGRHAITASLRRLDRIITNEVRQPFAATVGELVRPALDDLGWEPTPDEDDLRSKLRGLLVTAAAVLGDDVEAQARCRTILS